MFIYFFFSSIRRHTISDRDWSSDVCSSDLSGFNPPESEHRFAPYVRILGKGKSGSRSLSRAEARDAFGMILRGETRELQVGAFLMLLRVKEETGEELAGFVDACREEMIQPATDIHADLD